MKKPYTSLAILAVLFASGAQAQNSAVQSQGDAASHEWSLVDSHSRSPSGCQNDPSPAGSSPVAADLSKPLTIDPCNILMLRLGNGVTVGLDGEGRRGNSLGAMEGTSGHP